MRALLNGQPFTAEKVFESSDETTALLEEKRLIEHYGFANLLNTATHAFTGRKLKPEVGRLISARLTGRSLPAEVRAKIGASNRGRVASSTTRQKLSTAISARYQGAFTDAHRAKLSSAAVRRGAQPSSIEAMRQSNLGKHRDNTALLLHRKQNVYAIQTPDGAQLYAFSAGLVALLRNIGCSTTTFYRACSRGACGGFTVTKAGCPPP